METIDKKAMLHYLNEKQTELASELHNTLNDIPYRIENKQEAIIELKSQIFLLSEVLAVVTLNKINDTYDKHCILNGLDRTGKVFD